VQFLNCDVCLETVEKAAEAERRKMTIMKSITSVFILLLFPIIIGLNVQAQPQPNRNSTRQVGNMLQRLERSSSRFRNSLNVALVQGTVDQTQPQNDISTFQSGFDLAVKQFRDQFTRRLGVASDVESILQQASPINSFVTQNTLTPRVKNDWASVRTDLNTLASAYGVSWKWNQLTLMKVDSNRSFRLSENELTQLILQIENGGDKFRVSLTDAFFRRPYDRTRSEGNMNDALRGFKKATDQVRIRFDARQLVSDDVQRLLDQAQPLETFMRDNPLTDRARSDWSTLRANLNLLANAYNISPSWINNPPSQTANKDANHLTGTFRLDSARSDNPRDKAQRATQNLRTLERQEVAEQILARLESPEMLMLERRGTTMTIASSLAPKSTFEADGRERQEQLPNGKSTKVTATLLGEKLVVSLNGYKENDFNITFDATENDNSLRVRRQIYSSRLTQPVVVDSVYNRTADVAEWNVYNDSRPVVGNTGVPREFIVRDGESLVAVLNTDLTTKHSKQGDRFTMTVRQPSQYEDAVIEGTVGNVDEGGRLSGRSEMSLTFETIRLRNGQTYRFAGILESVRTLNGNAIKVDNEGTTQGANRTTQTIQRAGIATAVGAVIGAIAAGGKGAAIGGIIGAAGGAGSVFVLGKDNLELPSGSELTIRSSGPR
jgi:ABC-type transporter MlaC component